MCRRHCTEIALLVLNIGLCAVLVWQTHSQIQLNQLQHQEAQLPNELRQLEESTTAKISELKESLKEELRGAKGKISELEDEVRQLQEDLNILKTTKASQSELDNLSNTVSVLSQTKVNMTEFNNLLSNVSILRERVATKADKDAVLDLTQDVRILESTALNESHYDQLQSEIDMLKWSKINETNFEDLVANVTSLADSTVRTRDFLQLSETVTDFAKQQDLHRLDEKVSSHISSSQRTHSHYDSRISESDGAIRSNTAHITSVENDVRQLKDSTPGLTASWMIASTTVFLILVYMY